MKIRKLPPIIRGLAIERVKQFNPNRGSKYDNLIKELHLDLAFPFWKQKEGAEFWTNANNGSFLKCYKQLILNLFK